MQFQTAERVTILALCALVKMVYLQPQETLPATILGGIGSVASTATNFLSGVVQRQKELLHRVTDSATDYITSAVEKPRNLLINATRATTGIIDSAASRGLEFKLRRFLEKFRGRMRYGIPELDLPPLEPLQLDEIQIVIDNPEIGNISLVIQDLIINNLSTFVINKAKLSLIGPTITANLSVPEIHAEGYYNISGILGDMYPLHGVGPFTATIYDARVYVNTVLGFSRGMYIKSFDLDFSFSTVNVSLANFMGDDAVGKIMNEVLQELTPEVVDIIKPDILPGIQDYIVSRANETIHHLTMKDIFNVLVGQNEIRDITHLLIP